MATCKHILLITGEPGVGKTTLIRKIYSEICSKAPVGGFYTEEVRSSTGGRIGFDIVTLESSPNRVELARKGANTQYTVGQYGVFVNNIDKVTLPFLNVENCRHLKVLIIDEIGKMELKSRLFHLNISSLFSTHADERPIILATVPLHSSYLKFVEELKNREDSDLIEVTRQNRNDLCDKIINSLAF